MNAAILTRRVEVAVLGVAALSLLGTLAIGLYGEQLSGGPRPAASDSYGKGALGQRALVELLRAEGLRVDRIRSIDSGDLAPPLLFLAPRRLTQTPRGVLRLAPILERRLEAGLPTLLALPKWELRESLSGPVAQLRSIQEIEAYLTDVWPREWPKPVLSRPAEDRPPATPTPGLGSLDGIRLGLAHPQGIALPEGFGAVVLGRRAHASIVRLPDAQGRFWLVADPDLFHNFNLHRAENGAVLPLLAREQLGATHLLLDEVFHGHARQASLWAALGEFPQVLIVFHGLLLGLLVLGMGRVRFGPPLAPRPKRGRGPGEVLAVTATLLAHGQSAGRLAARWLDELLVDLAGRLRIEGTRQPAELAARLDASAARHGLEPLFVRLRERLRKDEGLPEGALLRLAASALERLHELAPRKDPSLKRGGVGGARTRETF